MERWLATIELLGIDSTDCLEAQMKALKEEIKFDLSYLLEKTLFGMDIIECLYSSRVAKEGFCEILLLWPAVWEA